MAVQGVAQPSTTAVAVIEEPPEWVYAQIAREQQAERDQEQVERYETWQCSVEGRRYLARELARLVRDRVDHTCQGRTRVSRARGRERRDGACRRSSSSSSSSSDDSGPSSEPDLADPPRGGSLPPARGAAGTPPRSTRHRRDAITLNVVAGASPNQGGIMQRTRPNGNVGQARGRP
jgi:hypothetical protein